MTGRFPLHHGINSVIDPWETNGGHPQIPGTGSYSLPLEETLLPQLMKAKGYATHSTYAVVMPAVYGRICVCHSVNCGHNSFGISCESFLTDCAMLVISVVGKCKYT